MSGASRPQSLTGPVLALSTAGLALLLYSLTVAPGLTWANHGADGGDLLAAAAANGVPHPSGYPLYVLLLQGWLALWGWAAPASDLAWRGNLFSALCAGLSVGVTALLAYHLLRGRLLAWVWAALAALAWAVSPLLWSQATITEVYAFHALLVSLLGWIALATPTWRPRWRPFSLGLAAGLGLAHHLTLALLLPALAYWLWSLPDTPFRRPAFWLWGSVGALLALLLYLRIPLAAAGQGAPPPVNWGYADNLSGFWWLVSGAAYRQYLFNLPPGQILGRISTWALTITVQYTVAGFALALLGLYYLDQEAGRLRNFSQLWLGPVSVYAIGYNTFDSDIYLLPVAWILALWLAYGLWVAAAWLARQAPVRQVVWAWTVAGFVALAALVATRFPGHSLRHDGEARDFLAGVAAVLEPGSLVFSSADAQTFALWYGAWASGELLEQAPGSLFVNAALYQFDWYRRLLADLYPDLPGMGGSPEQLLAANTGRRPIFFSEHLPWVPSDRLQPVGPIWQYRP